MNYPDELSINYPDELGMNCPDKFGMNYPDELGMNYPDELGMNYPAELGANRALNLDLYVPRILDGVMRADLGAFAGVLVTGARGVGKTRTALELARSTLRLDRAGDRSLAEADPAGAISDREPPLLIDEWQIVPEILRAVKLDVDSRRQAGRFIVTGSARNDLLRDTWPTTGRLIRIRLRGLVGREQFGSAAAASLFDRWDDPDERFVVPAHPPDLREYIEIALASGFPEALAISSDRLRLRWLKSYAAEIAGSDLHGLDSATGRRKDARRFAAYLESCALNTAGIVSHAAVYKQAGVNSRTAVGYEEALRSLGIGDTLPAWGSNRRKRVYLERSKRHIADAGLAAAIAGVTVDDVLAESDLRGRIIDTFATSQLIVEAEASDSVRLFHLRTSRGEHEIDVVAEVGRRLIGFEIKAGGAPARRDGRRLIGFEIKAGGAPTRRDARHLIWFRDKIAQGRFKGGVVFHTGRHRYELADRIEAVPIAGLWG